MRAIRAGTNAGRCKAAGLKWHMAMHPGKRRALDSQCPLHSLLEKADQLKASVRAKAEHPFRVIKKQFGYAKVRYRGREKNTAR
jgi:IS5 family transposase